MQTQQGHCPFCSIDPQRIIQSNEHGFAVRDGFPVSEGHSLIIPKRHVGSFFDLSTEEQHALLELLNETRMSFRTSDSEEKSLSSSFRPSSLSFRPKGEISSPSLSFRRSEATEKSTEISSEKSPSYVIPNEREESPSAFNIGINDGAAAGQTVPHCHIHLIPRYKGDVADPRGGVRWVIADKADYWSERK